MNKLVLLLLLIVFALVNSQDGIERDPHPVPDDKDGFTDGTHITEPE